MDHMALDRHITGNYGEASVNDLTLHGHEDREEFIEVLRGLLDGALDSNEIEARVDVEYGRQPWLRVTLPNGAEWQLSAVRAALPDDGSVHPNPECDGCGGRAVPGGLREVDGSMMCRDCEAAYLIEFPVTEEG